MPRTRPEYTEERAIRTATPSGVGKRRSYEPETWSPKHEMVARLHGVGIPNKKIASLLGLTESRVSIILNDARARPAVEDTLEAHKRQMESLHGRLAAGAGHALDVIEDQIQNDELDARVRQKASFGWLDRAGYTPVQKQIVLGGNIPPDALAGVMDALKVSEALEISYDVPLADAREEENGAASSAPQDKEQSPNAEQSLHNVRSRDDAPPVVRSSGGATNPVVPTSSSSIDAESSDA